MANILYREAFDLALFDALRAVYQFELSKVSKFDLNYEDIYLLQFLRRNSPARMSEIAKEMSIPISTATRVVDRLEKKKYISRKKDEKDRRSIFTSLETKGKRIVQKVEKHSFDIISKNLKTFSEEDFASFIKTAMCMRKILKSDGNSSTSNG